MILLRCIWHFSLKIAEAFVSISRMCNQFVKSCELEVDPGDGDFKPPEGFAYDFYRALLCPV